MKDNHYHSHVMDDMLAGRKIVNLSILYDTMCMHICSMCVCVYVCMYVCMCVYVCVYVCMCMCMYVYMLYKYTNK